MRDWSIITVAFVLIIGLLTGVAIWALTLHPSDETSCTVTTPYHPNTTAVILMDDGHCKVVKTP